MRNWVPVCLEVKCISGNLLTNTNEFDIASIYVDLLHWPWTLTSREMKHKSCSQDTPKNCFSFVTFTSETNIPDLYAIVKKTKIGNVNICLQGVSEISYTHDLDVLYLTLDIYRYPDHNIAFQSSWSFTPDLKSNGYPDIYTTYLSNQVRDVA